MAFNTANLVNVYSGPPGSGVYHYDAGSDSMATVFAAGYFNNTDDNQGLAADDTILCVCSDGDLFLRVASVSSGSVTTSAMSLEGPWNGAAGSASAALSLGITEHSGSASTFTLPTPVVGETVTVFKSATASGKVYTTDATDVTLSAGGERTITLDAQGAMFKLLAVTTTRWVVIASNNATIA